ncbi:MAG: YciI family protein [Pseudobdellovibrionaceae bacterium]
MIRKILFVAIAILGFVAEANQSKKPTTGESPEAPPVQYVVFHKPGPKWQKGVDFREQPGVREHVIHYAKIREEGKLFLGGPFLDGSGGMMITSYGISKEEVEKFAAEDPAIKSGLLAYEIKPWLIAMKSKSRF